MADESTGEKTEKASPKKLKDAREKGQVVRSRDLVVALASLAITLQATVALVTPNPMWILPGELGQFIDWSYPIALSIAVALFLALLIDPQWYVVDLAGFVAGLALRRLRLR